MRIAAILQARTGSTRLPRKTLALVEGKPLLWHVIQRLKKAKTLDEIIVATTKKEEDEKIIEVAKEAGIAFFQGSEDDVLDRYYQAAKKFKTDVIVRVTADCPLLDPSFIDEVVKKFLEGRYDYVCNTNPPTYPDGLDVEVFSFKTLERAWKEAALLSEREHVTPYIWKNPDKFRLFNFTNAKDLSYMRWTVDEKEDLDFVREVFRILREKNKMDFDTEEIIEILEENRGISAINRHLSRNEGYLKSLREDKKIKRTIK